MATKGINAYDRSITAYDGDVLVLPDINEVDPNHSIAINVEHSLNSYTIKAQADQQINGSTNSYSVSGNLGAIVSVSIPTLEWTVSTITGPAGSAGGSSISVPIGGIIMWSGAANTIPTGFAPCDGGTYNGVTTPNMQGVMPLGADGGNNNALANGSTNFGRIAVGTYGGTNVHAHGLTTKSVGSNTLSQTAASPGNTSTVSSLPASLALIFIMRVQ